MSDPILVTLREAAQRLHISQRTLWQLVREHRVPHVVLRGGRRRLIRFCVKTLEAWAAEQARLAGQTDEEPGR